MEIKTKTFTIRHPKKSDLKSFHKNINDKTIS